MITEYKPRNTATIREAENSAVNIPVGSLKQTAGLFRDAEKISLAKQQ